jgi:aspartyl-tRNA(Asn)/glutamyl-tRNA(Gln) amidotransferase subunit C
MEQDDINERKIIVTTLTHADVEKVARLARLAIPEEKISLYIKNLTNILELVEQMNAIDTSHIMPMAHPLDIPQPFREDTVTESNQRELLQSITDPNAKRAGFYLVPKVIE